MTYNARLAAKVGSADGSPPAKETTNNRFAGRKAAQTPAKILWEGITTPFECTVRDISSTGAQLEMSRTKFNPEASPAALPHEFVLIIPLDRTAVDCRSMWRRGSRVGVRFMGMVRPLAPARPSMLPSKGSAGGSSLRRAK
jgi:hypothetical protein